MKDQISKQNNESEIEDLIKQKVTMMVDPSELANKKREQEARKAFLQNHKTLFENRKLSEANLAADGLFSKTLGERYKYLSPKKSF
tara:strand:- start:545 stop:802 length:258 start_codon:yes stop_codon:yes gene_type:complete